MNTNHLAELAALDRAHLVHPVAAWRQHEARGPLLLTGARANVHPTRFKTEPHPGHEPYDESRDALALTLAEVCVARGIPILGVCRGFQDESASGGSR